MKNTKNTKKNNKNVTPEFVLVYTVHDDGDRGMGAMTYDITRLVTRKQLDLLIANRGTEWIKKLYKVGNEVKINNKIEFIEN